MKASGGGLSVENQKVVHRLQKRWLKNIAFVQRTFQARRRSPPDSRFTFIMAVYQCSKNRPQDLIDYLRSNRPLERNERDILADFFEDQMKPAKKPKRGRPRLRLHRTTAWEASFFYKQWREENKRMGVMDRGQGNAMKDEAVRFVIEEFQPTNVDPEIIRSLMDRPLHRRNL